MTNKLTEGQFTKIIWIGGSPCAGKSTCAEALAKEYGYPIYCCDDYFYKHMERADPSRSPALYRLKGMPWNEIWMRPVEVLLEDEIQIYQEEFEMIIQDLTELNVSSNLIILEGAALFPELLHRIGVNKNQVLYLLPTREFQYENYSKREFIKGILKECVNPEAAFRNWMERDQEMAKYIRQKAMALGYRYLIIDGSKSVAEVFETTKVHFQGIIPGNQ